MTFFFKNPADKRHTTLDSYHALNEKKKIYTIFDGFDPATKKLKSPMWYTGQCT